MAAKRRWFGVRVPGAGLVGLFKWELEARDYLRLQYAHNSEAEVVHVDLPAELAWRAS